jgi:hypothetical protein
MSSLTDREQRIKDRGQAPGRPSYAGVVTEGAPEPIVAAFAEYAMRIEDERTKAIALAEAEKAVPDARAADERALGLAIRAGGKDPGPKETERATKALDEARRQAGGARVATDETLAGLRAAVAEHRPAWLETIAGRRAKAHAAAERAREVLRDALAELQAVVALETFVIEFESTKRYRAPADVVPVLAAVHAMLEQIGPRREQPRDVMLRDRSNAELEVAGT